MIQTLNIQLIHGIYAEDSWEITIEVPENYKLIDLSSIILDSIEFDDDHLFEFYISKLPRSKMRERFECDEEEITKISIGEIAEKLTGKSLFYLFDYGDSWLFKINKTRKKLFTPIKNIQYPQIIKQVGTKPEQYPDYDEY
ncbi:IS1096 element passenger TnpR family protein [Marinicellulosiphila megalodicopiae]|uniref:IS1096 element passenger TnpR family protein n=1 Tax=Marinicellulosiphila megalodicopiae TaxID=2724896 RepID=UPI003BAF9100